MKKSLSHETPFQPKKLLNKFSAKLLVRKTTISVENLSVALLCDYLSFVQEHNQSVRTLSAAEISKQQPVQHINQGKALNPLNLWIGVLTDIYSMDFGDKTFERGSQGEIIIPEVAYNWTMVTIREAWRRNRSDLKMTYYDPYDNDDVRMTKRPDYVCWICFGRLKWMKLKNKLAQMVDAFSAVMGPEHRGRLRLYGVELQRLL
ncbi:hypothetical protein H5410_022476 [Solanum commersonii]|uniref:Uncharacterized protein n=1 Tax=Solanum commersonii TaxID=4109 RepID=A0A9J5ZE39_SOLCO|nr:hypothetical protein H5410_022476 [Solanum commersonii]